MFIQYIYNGGKMNKAEKQKRQKKIADLQQKQKMKKEAEQQNSAQIKSLLKELAQLKEEYYGLVNWQKAVLKMHLRKTRIKINNIEKKIMGVDPNIFYDIKNKLTKI